MTTREAKRELAIMVLRSRAAAAKKCFLDDHGRPTRAGEIVLAHLRRFCRANRPTVAFSSIRTIDPLAMAVAEGRREVWLRLREMIDFSDEQIAKLREETGEHDEYAAT